MAKWSWYLKLFIMNEYNVSDLLHKKKLYYCCNLRHELFLFRDTEICILTSAVAFNLFLFLFLLFPKMFFCLTSQFTFIIEFYHRNQHKFHL
jgi:hypothetical protein